METAGNESGRQKIETRLEKTTITEKWKEIIHNSTTQNESCLISVNVIPPSFITLIRVVKVRHVQKQIILTTEKHKIPASYSDPFCSIRKI